MVRWSVIDQGAGIAEREIRRMAQRQDCVSDDEGPGLPACRPLAAAHFSTLQVRSRLGYGTEVSFSTPAAGPRSIAGAWSRWRVAARVATRGPLRKPGLRSDELPGRQLDLASEAGYRVRLDPPSIEIEIAGDSGKPRCDDRFAAGSVVLGAAVSRANADAFNNLFQAQMQMFELAYRTDVRRWVWIFDVDTHDADGRIAMINELANSQIGGVRMAWSTPQIIPVDPRRTQIRLSDLMVRESLAASSSSPATDHNEVRLGTSPIVPSDIATLRLDAELRRLGHHMRGQTARMKQQATSLSQ